MITEKRKTTEHIRGLDGLQTLAILGIILFHLLPQVFAGGYLGVSLFFVPKVISAVRPEVWSVLLGYNNWWQIEQNADYFTRIVNQSPFTHLWFLGIELQYYLLWPLYFIFYVGMTKLYGKRIGVIVTACCGLAAALLMPFMYQPGMDVTRLYYGTDTRIYALILGTALGLCHVDFSVNLPQRKWLKPFKYGLFLLLLFFTSAGYVLLNGQSPLVYQGGMFLATLGFCVILVLTVDKELQIGEIFQSFVFRWIGKKSYGIFLWQYPVIFLFHCMKWDTETVILGTAFPEIFSYGMPIAEIAVIILLTIWSDALLNCLSTLRELSFAHRRVIIYTFSVFLISIPGFAMMGYGCKGIVESAEYKSGNLNELKTRLEQNEMVLREQPTNKATLPVSKKEVNLNGIACIGDSVMLDSAVELKKVLPDCYIDAQVSRYVGAGVEVAEMMNEQGLLGNVVLISLGTNGPLDGQYAGETQALLSYLGPERHIFWVNVYCPYTGWQESNNAYLKKIEAEYPNVTSIDWCKLISDHPEWLTEDGIHPDTAGTKEYAGLIYRKISETLRKYKYR